MQTIKWLLLSKRLSSPDLLFSHNASSCFELEGSRCTTIWALISHHLTVSCLLIREFLQLGGNFSLTATTWKDSLRIMHLAWMHCRINWLDLLNLTDHCFGVNHRMASRKLLTTNFFVLTSSVLYFLSKKSQSSLAVWIGLWMLYNELSAKEMKSACFQASAATTFRTSVVLSVHLKKKRKELL